MTYTPRLCAFCDTPFSSKYPDAQFCSRECVIENKRKTRALADEQMIDLYVNQGASLRNIAAFIGCSHIAVRNRLVKLDVILVSESQHD